MAACFTHRVRPLVAVLSLGTAAVIAVPAIAAADPASPGSGGNHKPSIASVQKKLGRLTMKNAELVEQFNQARVQVTKRSREAQAAQRQSAKAAASYDTANSAFTRVVQAQYESGGFGGSGGALLTSNNSSSYLNAVSSMNLVSSHEAQVVQTVQRSKLLAEQAYSRSQQLLTAAKSDRHEVEVKKAAVTKQITSYRAQLAKLTAAQLKTFTQTMSPSVNPSDLRGLANAAPTAAAKRAVSFAIDQIGKPYVFGASGPSTYDCSGLTMMAWKAGGVSLPHSALQQYNYGTHVSRSQLQPGDLIFFYNPIGHVTIYVGGGMMVSAPESGEDVSLVPLSNFNSDYAGATHLK